MSLTVSPLKSVLSCRWPAKAGTSTCSCTSSFMSPLGLCQCTAPEWRALDNTSPFTCCTCRVYIFFDVIQVCCQGQNMRWGGRFFGLMSIPSTFTYMGLWCNSDTCVVSSTPLLKHFFGAFLNISAISLTTWQYFRPSSARRQQNSDHLPNPDTTLHENATTSKSL